MYFFNVSFNIAFKKKLIGTSFQLDHFNSLSSHPVSGPNITGKSQDR
jgi:hypothetical protein